MRFLWWEFRRAWDISAIGAALNHRRWIVVVTTAFNGEDVFHQLFEVIAIMSQIEILGINDQERRAVVIMKKTGVGIVQRIKVVGADVLLDRYTALANTITEYIQRRLQVDHQLWARGVDSQFVVYLLVDTQLVIIKRNLRE